MTDEIFSDGTASKIDGLPMWYLHWDKFDHANTPVPTPEQNIIKGILDEFKHRKYDVERNIVEESQWDEFDIDTPKEDLECYRRESESAKIICAELDKIIETVEFKTAEEWSNPIAAFYRSEDKRTKELYGESKKWGGIFNLDTTHYLTGKDE